MQYLSEYYRQWCELYKSCNLFFDDQLTAEILDDLKHVDAYTVDARLNFLKNNSLTYFKRTPCDFNCKQLFIPKEDLPSNYIDFYVSDKYKKTGDDLISFLLKRGIYRMYAVSSVSSTDLLYNMVIDFRLYATPDNSVQSQIEELFRCVQFLMKYDKQNLFTIAGVETLHYYSLNLIKEGIYSKSVKTKQDREMAKKQYTDNKISRIYRKDLTIKANAKRAGVSETRMKEWIAEFGALKQERMLNRLAIIKTVYDKTKSIKENFDNPEIQKLNISFRTYQREVKKAMTQEEITQLFEDAEKVINTATSISVPDVETLNVDQLLNEAPEPKPEAPKPEAQLPEKRGIDYTDEQLACLCKILIKARVKLPTPYGEREISTLPVFGDVTRLSVIRAAIATGYLYNVSKYIQEQPFDNEVFNVEHVISCRLKPNHATLTVGDTRKLELGKDPLVFADMDNIEAAYHSSKQQVRELPKRGETQRGLF